MNQERRLNIGTSRPIEWGVKADLSVSEGYVYPSLNLDEIESWLDRFTDKPFSQIANDSERVMGSNAWLEKMMNFKVERDAIKQCKINYERVREENNPDNRDREFREELDTWMRVQLAFACSELGCGKFLTVQPEYEFILGREENGELFSLPAGVRRFGDQARRYVVANERVGEGLYWGYGNMFDGGPGTWAGVMSATEEYQEYDSTYDVINLMKVEGIDRDGMMARGMYVIMNRVLSTEERRFVHNTFYLLANSEWSIRQLSELDKDVLVQLVSTDELWVEGLDDGNTLEREWLVKRPNVFAEEDMTLLDMAGYLNKVFEKRFGESLVPKKDIDMGLQIQSIVDEFLPTLIYYLWENPDKLEYYRALRAALYKSQIGWKEQEMNRRNIPVENYAIELARHIQMLVDGQLQVGFEFGGPIEGSVNWSEPFGFSESVANYCDIHEQAYSGSKCPSCSLSEEGNW